MIKSKDTLFRKNYTLNCRGTIVDLSTPSVMGIVNLTPDSFHDGGTIKNEKDLLLLVERHVNDGATFIDIGGFSSRPGSDIITEKEELIRLSDSCKLISNRFPEIFISVDTYRSNVAKEVLDQGAHVINDISGGHLDPLILKVCAEYSAPFVCMHMKDNPFIKHENPLYQNLLEEILDYFSLQIKNANKSQLFDIIIDPGFGFGKTNQNNFQLLKRLKSFEVLNAPILIGLSRKRMVHETLGINSNQALNGTTSLHTIALNNGAHILRAHDTKEAKEVVDLYTAYNNA